MAITVNGQILRNLPEQVSKNTEDILELQEQSNNYGIRITALEGDAIALATFEDCTFTGTTAISGTAFIVSAPVTISGSVSQTGGNVSIGGNLSVSGNSNIFERIVDASGNKRFLEGDLQPETISGVQFSYYKWSLSGTHLMLVVAGTIENGTTIPIDRYFARFNSVPSFIYNKIVAITSDGLGVDIKDITFYTTGWGSIETHKVRLNKQYGILIIASNETFTVNADKTFRIQFDLLIDNS